MIIKPILLASLAPMLLLGGCMGTQNRGLESVHQPVVDRADYALDLGTANGGLARGEAQRLTGWMNAMRVGYGDRIAIDDPAGTGTQVRDDVARVVAGYGLLLSDDAPVSQAPVAPGAIRVIVSRSQARVRGCPDWSRDAAHEFESNTSSNYGCAVNANLAAMVANPADLVRGARADATDAAVSFKAIDTFRKATPTGGGNQVKTEGTGGK